MLDHLSLGTVNLERAIKFYDAILAPLGIVRVWTRADGVGYGYPGDEDKLAIKLRQGAVVPGPGFHVAPTARTQLEVDTFFRAALDHGGTDDGKPGLRPHYGDNYYAAFVADPDGYRVEAVCHDAAPATTKSE
jgi:catechol 2,3-dioxygenase-like lactoylglutathione lyase family enzyme